MKNLDTVYTDASCYESLMRFPTDVKLLWECVDRAYKMMCGISSQLGEHRMRTKYNDIDKANLAYRKQRKHTHKQTRKMIMRLLALLGKILGEIRRQMRVHPDEELLNYKQLDMLETVTRVYRQQKIHFKSGDSRESIPNRIVSLSKPYIRPIVRGKETKIVEFGAKCNNILIDGISFIEKLSFNAFNEGTRLKHCVSFYSCRLSSQRIWHSRRKSREKQLRTRKLPDRAVRSVLQSFIKKFPSDNMAKFLPYYLRELFYAISALRIFPSSRLANTIASTNAAASAIGPAYITPSIPINNGKIMINGRRKITCRVRDITIPSFAIPIEVKKPEDTGWIPFAKVININIFR